MTSKDDFQEQFLEGADDQSPFLDTEIVEDDTKAKEKEKILFDFLEEFYNEYLICDKEPQKGDKRLFQLAKDIFKSIDDYSSKYEELFREAMALSKVTLREYLQIKTLFDFVASDDQINKSTYQEVFGGSTEGLVGKKRLVDIIGDIETNVSKDGIVNLLGRAKCISMMERGLVGIKGSELFSEFSQQQQQETGDAHSLLSESLDAKLDSITDDFLDDKVGQVSDHLTELKSGLSPNSQSGDTIDLIDKYLKKIHDEIGDHHVVSPPGMM